MKDVTAAIMFKDGQVLIARRAPGEKHAGGWEFPGGKVEAGETPEECLKRELNEEFGIDTEVKGFIKSSLYEYTQGSIRLLAYQVDILKGNFQLRVHDRYEWVRVDELLNYELLPADVPIAMYLKDQKFLSHLREYLVDKYSCHSIILHGSYANGDYTEESDVDVVCFCDGCEEQNDTSFIEHTQLDVWIYRTEKMKQPEEFLYLREGQVLLDKNGVCREFLEEVSEVYKKGPEPLTDAEKEFHKSWFKKMQKRSQKEDVEGNFRFHWMLTDSLEIYFKIKGIWYMGSKKSLKWLYDHDREMYVLYERAFRRQAKQCDIDRLVNRIAEL